MGKKTTAFSVFLYNWRRIVEKPRFYLVLVASMLYIMNLAGPFCEYSKITNRPVSMCLFPIFMSNQGCVLILFLLAVLLFCDAPFLENSEPFILIRSGRKSWLIAQCLYVITLSAFYVIHLLLCTYVSVFLHGAFIPEWGDLIYSLANTNACDLVQLTIKISPQLLSRYTPGSALNISLLTSFLVVSFIGSIMFCVNLSVHRTVGTVLGSLFVLEQFLASNASGYSFYYFSPVSWVNLNVLNISGAGKTPSFPYVLVFLLGTSVLCWGISAYVFKKKDIQVLSTL